MVQDESSPWARGDAGPGEASLPALSAEPDLGLGTPEPNPSGSDRADPVETPHTNGRQQG